MHNQKDPRIAERESWAKIIIVSVFFAIIAWKLANMNWQVNLTEFKFTDLLNLILAIFAIALSIAFYFKATETSNTFYDNTYKFTKDVSEILGRIEAGFGERLRHLDEGYSGLRAKFEHTPVDSKEAEKDIKQEEKQVQKKEQERNQLIENLAARAQLQENEKKALFDQLRMKDEELLNSKRELNFFRHRMEESQSVQSFFADLPKGFIDYFENSVVRRMDRVLTKEGPRTLLNREFERIKPSLPAGFIDDCQKYGLLEDTGVFNLRGVQLVRFLARRLHVSS